VEVAPVRQQDVPIYREWVATLDGYVNAQIQPQVTGYLLAQDFREGSFVRKDDVLFEIDPRPFQATLDQARAQLAQSEANASKAARDLERDTPLAEARAIPRSQLDNDVQAHRAAVAAVDAARAQVRIAELNLSFTKGLSLIDGIVGITQVQIGQPRHADQRAHDGVADRADQGLLRDQRAGISRCRGANHRGGPGDASGGRAYPVSTDPERRYHLSPPRLVPDRRSAGRSEDRHDPDRDGVPEPPASAPSGPVRADPCRAEVRRGALLVPQRAVSELQGSYQVAVVGVTTARSASARSRSARAWTRCG